MPCNDNWSDTEVTSFNLSRQLSRVEAMLCGIVTVLKNDNQLDDVLSKVDWKEAGVKRSAFSTWWADHQIKDELRRKRERAEEQKKLKKLEQELIQRKALYEQLKKEFGDDT